MNRILVPLWLGTKRLATQALAFWICGSCAWLSLLLLDVAAERPEPQLLLPRTLYLTQLACRYSTRCVLPLALLHGLRLLWLRRSARADGYLSVLLLAVLAPLTYQKADLLSSGSLLLESAFRVHGLWLMFAALLLGNLALWHVHLALCAAPRHPLSRAVERRSRAVRIASVAMIALLGAAALYAFSETVSRELRAYLFLSQFLLPSAYLFAASLAYALQREAPRWLVALGALALAAGLIAAGLDPVGVRRAKAFFERRAGLIALTDLSSSSARGAPYANLDISQPARFRCDPEPPAAARPAAQADATHRNVILISIDTLRKDALELQQNGAFVAPSLRMIAERSLSFERAVTTYPATLFAVSSALTGQSPSEVMFAPRPPDNLFTRTRARFQELLIALPSAGWFKRPPVPQLFTQGVAPLYFQDADRTTRHVIKTLRDARSHGRNLLAWIHYYEPHTSRVAGRGQRAEQISRASYAELVHSVDVQLGKLWQELDRLGYLSDSLVIVFSDHGEALGEFGYFGHHVYLNQFATDIPLLVHAPGVSPRRSEQLALLSDITPTVLQWLGLPAPAGDAHSLLALPSPTEERFGMSEAFPVRGRALYDVARKPIRSTAELAERMQLIRTAAIDYQPKVALVSSRYRLIVNRVTGAEEFYDRAADPQEKRDLSADSLPAHTRMRDALSALMERLSERIYCRVQAAAADPGRGPL